MRKPSGSESRTFQRSKNWTKPPVRGSKERQGEAPKEKDGEMVGERGKERRYPLPSTAEHRGETIFRTRFPGGTVD